MSTHYFIAIRVDEMRSELTSVQRSLDTSLFKHIVAPDDFHITLQFLGDAQEEQLLDLGKRLEEIARDTSPFEMSTTRIETFGKVSQPRVLYVGVEKEEALLQLHKRVLEVCEEVGFRVDRREYRPHITLLKKWKNPDKKMGPDMPEVKKVSQNVSSIELFQVAPKEIPRYKCVERYDFQR